MMNTCLYAVLLAIVWALIMAEGLAEGSCRVELEDDMECIPNYFNCTHSTRPCCREQHLRAGSDVFEEFVCFRFGKGICEPLKNITNLENYAQLAENLNSTNFSERLHLFKHNVKIDISDSEFDSSSYLVIGVCVTMAMSMYGFTIVLFFIIKRAERY
ncbi:Cys2 [Hyposoter didymator ichnovirus]|nr:Cys2 [Hyposoter didymator ichnovirus]